MPARGGTIKGGTIKGGHPYVDILVSADGKVGTKYSALIDTGYSGFVSIPGMAASLLGLKSNTTTRYTLANGKQTDPIPLAEGYACVEGDSFVKGLIAFSENTSVLVGVEFLTSCGHMLMMGSSGIALLNEKEMLAALKQMQQDAKAALDAAQKEAVPAPLPPKVT